MMTIQSVQFGWLGSGRPGRYHGNSIVDIGPPIVKPNQKTPKTGTSNQPVAKDPWGRPKKTPKS